VLRMQQVHGIANGQLEVRGAVVGASVPHHGPMLIKPIAGSARTSAGRMAGERELTTGLLARDASFRLIVSGNIGVKEIERLIKKLELDKEILADQDEAESDAFK
ncbi:MAG: hypothetical protein ACJ8FZ_22945, partial [Bradyrhizobium sp.]